MKRKAETTLESWRTRSSRLPLLVYGARQVGKTYLLREFGRTHYDNVAYVNLETNRSAAAYFADDISPTKLVQFLETETGQRILPERTLIILDEIQSTPRALTSLKYFAEEAPSFHIAGAGSLLGVALNREEQSYPVGNVTSLTLHPLDFEEFLWAMGEDRLAEAISQAFIDNTPLPAALHQRGLDIYRQYLVVGGMPRAVNEFLTTSSLLTVGDIQRGIVNDYTADMAKYASASEAVKIRAAYSSLPAQLAKDNRKFQYKVALRGGTASTFGVAIDWLTYAGIALRCDRVTDPAVPLSAYRDMVSFKLYMGDTGLLTLASETPISVLINPGSDTRFLGAITENYVAQTLIANQVPLYYWANDGRAEIDFLIQADRDIVPIEVKSSMHTRSRSLSLFTEQYDTAYSIRLSTKNFGHDNSIKSVPLYAAHCIRSSGRFL